MKAGRELDEAVAIALGWKHIPAEHLPPNHWPWLRPDGAYTYNLPSFSGDLVAAMAIVEGLQDSGRRIDMMAYRSNGLGVRPYRVEIRSLEHDMVMTEANGNLAEAICTAALEALNATKGD